MTLKIKIQRNVNGKTHTAHLTGHDVSMHLDIIEKVIDRANRLNVRPELIETIWENGYTREDY